MNCLSNLDLRVGFYISCISKAISIFCSWNNYFDYLYMLSIPYYSFTTFPKILEIM